MNDFKPFDFTKEFGLISSKYLSNITGINHKNIISLIEKYKYDIWVSRKQGSLTMEELEECVKFKKISIKTSELGTSKSYMLTEEQCKFIICLMKNKNNNNNITYYKQAIALNSFDDNILHYNERGFVYVLSKNNQAYKIGRTYNLKQRYRAIITQAGDKNIKLIAISDFIFEYAELENALHNLYKNNLIIGEWYKLNDDELLELLNHLENNGLTIYDNKNNSITKLNYYIDYNISKNLLSELTNNN
jgi:5'-3' exonuclease